MPTGIFERQDQARLRTWLLVGVFALVLLGLLVLMNALILFMVHPHFIPGFSTPLGQPDRLAEGLADARGLMIGFSAALLALIAWSALRMILRLRAGGRAIAQDLGGEPVKADSSDPGERRLRNVVEEMALAASVITPGVYVLRDEPGINAFAAGLTPAESVVTVTRGALDKLTRDELQGVVAHEMGHIVNGDTRLNTWLMAIVHGLEAVAMTGHRYMRSHRRRPRRHHRLPGAGRAPRGGGSTLVFGLSMYLLGLLGVFCSRLVKAAIVRQREWLADAAAMQYARYPEGLAGALKKVAAGRRLGSALLADRRQEVSHMLFAPGLGFADTLLAMLSTHPPLEERIRQLDPGYRSHELDDVRERMHALLQQRQREREQGEPEPVAEVVEDTGDDASRVPSAQRGGVLNDAVILSALAGAGSAGSLGLRRDRAELAGVARPLYDAAKDPERVRGLIIYLLLAPEVEVRRRQLEAVTAAMGEPVQADVLALLAEYGRLSNPAHRLPLLELALPALKGMEQGQQVQLLAAVGRMLRCTDGLAVHEYALSRLLQLQLRGATAAAEQTDEVVALHESMDHAALVLGVLAEQGCPDDPEGAYQAGMAAMLVPAPPTRNVPEAWVAPVTRALATLAHLDGAGRRTFMRGLAATAAHAGEVTVAEAELLRVIVVSLHLPVPLILPTDAMAGPAGEADAEA